MEEIGKKPEQEVIGTEVIEAPAEPTLPSFNQSRNAYLLTGDDNASYTQAIGALSSQGLDALVEYVTFTPEQQAERAERAQADYLEKFNDVYTYPDFAYDQLVAMADPEVSLTDARYTINSQIGQSIIDKYKQIEAEDDGIVDITLDFLNLVVRDSSIGIGYNVTKGSEDMGLEIAQRKMTMRPSEFKEWAENRAAELMQYGLRENTSWYLDQFINEMTNDGYDPSANLTAVLSLLDIAGVAGGAGKLAKAATKASTWSGRLTALKGVDEATDVVVKSAIKGGDDEALKDLTPKVFNDHDTKLTPSQQALPRAMEENRIIAATKDLYTKGTFGKVVEEGSETLAKLTDEAVSAFKARTGYRIVDNSIVPDNLGNFSVNIEVGTVKGTTFKTTKSGEIPASVVSKAKEYGGEAVLKDPDNPSAGAVIRFKENIKLTGAIDEIDPNELMAVNTNFIAKIVNNKITSSAASRGVEAMTVAAQRAEAGASKLQEVFGGEVKKINNLNATERAQLNLITELRDGKNASRRDWFTKDEFINEYRTRFNQAPSQKLLDAYDATVTINDAAWLLKARQVFNKYVLADYRAIQMGEIYRPAKMVPSSSVPVDARVLDGRNMAKLNKGDFRGENVTYWKLDRPTDEGFEYVADARSRALEVYDVLGYNAGGTRLNPMAKYFVQIGSGNRIKTLLAAGSEKQAKLAKEQIDNLRKAGDGLTDDMVRKNNDWNPNLQTAEDFRNFAKENKWDDWVFDELASTGVKQRDRGIIGMVGQVDADEFLNLDDFVAAEMMRNDRVLPSFGGEAAFNVDTVTAVQQQFASVGNEFAFHVATQQSIIGWVNAAKKIPSIKFPDNVSSTDYRNLFLRAEINGTDELSNRMREVRSIEMRRMNMKSEASKSLEYLGESIAEYVFDLGDKQLFKTRGLTKGKAILQSSALGSFIQDPSKALLKLGFTTAFGFFNVAQMLVQSIHAASIMLISKQGVKGASMAMTLRGLFHASPEAVEEGLKRAAKTYGYTPEKMKEIFEYVRTSGRDIIEGDAAELGTGPMWNVSGWGGNSYKVSNLDKAIYNTSKYGRKAMDKGLMFYRFGERASRMTGVYTAIAEYVARNPNVNLLSEAARKEITKREQTLGLQMTTSSRGFAQSGVLRVPTQWLSYNLRAMEAIFVGRGFTKGERARLAASLTFMYGLSGFGAERAAEEIAGMFGWGEDSAAFTTLKWGVIDGIMDALLPEGEGEGRVGTGLAKRLSIVQGILDTYNKIGGEATFMEVVGGPSYNIGKSFLEAGVSVISNGLAGNPQMLTEDVLRLIRQPSGIDNVAKAIGIFNNGLYTSKTGVAVPAQMTPTEGIMALFGVNNLKATEWYATQSQVFTDKKKMTEFRKEMNKRAEVAYRLMQDGNTERGVAMLGEIRTAVAFSGFSPTDQASIMRSVLTKDEDSFNRTFEYLLKADKDAALRLLAVQR